MASGRWREFKCRHCGSIFLICSNCYRGQRYCSPSCGIAGYRLRKRRANTIYSKTEGGRKSHRERNKRHRCREGQPSTGTDRTYAVDLAQLLFSPPAQDICAFCGGKLYEDLELLTVPPD